MHRIIYNTNTGRIESCRRMSDSVLALQLKQAPNLASINGFVENNLDYKIDLDTLEVVSQNNPFNNFNVQYWMRQRRTNLLKDTDWTQGEDSPLSAEKKAEWQTYRQALRDVPANNTSATSKEDVVWPTPPGA